jgi:hypothetical protein
MSRLMTRTKLLLVLIVVMLVTASVLGYYAYKLLPKEKVVAVAETTPVPIPEPKFCNRTTPNKMEPEFSRALSLFEQRFSQSNPTFDTYKYYVQYNVKNCLFIFYQENSGSEGVFRGVSRDLLSIGIDPKYASGDDLLLADVLAHEISHAVFYTNVLVNGKEALSPTEECYVNEAKAHLTEMEFYLSLNKEEADSLLNRGTTGSKALKSKVRLLFSQKPADYYQKALTYVKSQDSYKKQCGSL